MDQSGSNNTNIINNIVWLSLDFNKPASAWIAWVFGIVSIILTIGVGVPQLISLIKNKDTGDGIKYYTFWIFFSGILGWTIIGSFDAAETKKLATAIANMVSSIIFAITIFLSYLYSRDQKRKSMAYIIGAFSITLALTIAAVSLYGIIANKRMPGWLMNISVWVFPVLTTFSFLPAAISSFMKGKFEGMSSGMLITLLTLNIGWLGYWIALGLNSSFDFALNMAIVWQVLALLIYLSLTVLLTVNVCQKQKNKNFAR